jgi:DNA-binding response OmpR family regulator
MPSIVVADDQPDLLAILSARLRAAGFEVHEAQDGQQALQAVQDKKPDIVLLDVMMPELNGFQVCRSIKSDDALKQIPVVLLTAKDGEADKFWGSEVGADLYLTKPINPAAVVLKVSEMLGAG